MRIGIFSESFLPQVNGVVTSICNTSRILVSKGHHVRIFTSGGGLRKTTHERMGCFDVYRLGGFTFKPYPAYKIPLPTSSKWVFLLKNARDLDVLHTRGPITLGLLAKRLSQKLNIPIIGTFDTPLSHYVRHYIPLAGSLKPSRYFLSKLANRYSIWFYNRCRVVVAPSRITGDWLRKLGCRREIRVISNGVDTKKYNPRNRSEAIRKRFCPGNGFFILHVGRVTREKRIHVLIKAAESLHKRGVKFKLVIAGDGPARAELQKVVREHGLSGCVLFTGYVPEEDLPLYYASADLFVTASTVETEGIVLLEAMASGIPIIGANAGGIPELINDDENGFLFEPGNHEMLSNLIEVTLNDGYLKRKMGRLNRAATEGYSIERTVDEIEKLYKELDAR